MRRIARVLGTSLFLVAGCATAPPTTALTAASGALGAAEEAGAATALTAEQSLAAARQEFAEANALIDQRDHRAAYGLLVRAKADADLAAALARQEQLSNEADQLARRAEALRSQTAF
jgi:hypothetical protein